ncbi:MAG TPA: hypothetical protein VGU64_16875 [Terriglobales bacterium]|nr:hypothetical protein [Terriglobales bacterium]
MATRTRARLWDATFSGWGERKRRGGGMDIRPGGAARSASIAAATHVQQVDMVAKHAIFWHARTPAQGRPGCRQSIAATRRRMDGA